MDWDHEPNEHDRERVGTPLKPRPKVAIIGICLSCGVTGKYIHYCAGRTLPCYGETCRVCSEDANKPRWKGWFTVWQPASGIRRVAEITPNCWAATAAWQAAHGGLRGSKVRLRRDGPRENSPVVAEWTESSWSGDALPDDLDVAAYLCRLWGVTVLDEVRRAKRVLAQPDLPVPPRLGDVLGNGTAPGRPRKR